MDDRDSMRWVWRGVALAALVIGWVFIAWQNHFHISAPLVFVCLGYLAVVATVYNLWRTGASAVASDQDEDDSTWARPTGALGELERERRTLLKAIKEAEFDQQMNKLSTRDAGDMIETYKARIYEVYAEIDRLQLGTAGSKREAILREVKARLEVEARSAKKAGKAEAKVADKAKPSQAKQAAEAKADAVEAAAAQAIEAKAEAIEAKAAAAIEDEAFNADSTTTREPSVEAVVKDTGKRAAKEATP